jgi:hypothetical protein
MKTKLNLDLADVLKQRYPRGFHAPADIDIDGLIEFGDEDWEHVLDIDVRQLLARQNAIALIWDADMLLSTYPHLTPEQAWEVLQQCERDYSAEEGLTWDLVAEVVHDRFPDAPEAKQRLLDRLTTLRRMLEALPAQERDDPAGYGGIAAQVDALEDAIMNRGE